MNYNIKFTILKILFVTILISCSEVPFISDSVSTGRFIDAPVSGIRYKTETQDGLTNQKGEFKYLSGETVTFYLGNIALGENTKTQTMMTPITVTGGTGTNNIPAVAVNIARVLQSIDNNLDPTSTIIIPETLVNLDGDGLDFNDDTDLQDILDKAEQITNVSYSLKTPEDAEEALKDSLNHFIYSGTYIGNLTLNRSQSNDYTGFCSKETSITLILGVPEQSVSNQILVTGTIGTGSNQRNVAGLSFTNSQIQGTLTSDAATNIIASIDNEGNLTGTYNIGDNRCAGEIIANKQ